MSKAMCVYMAVLLVAVAGPAGAATIHVPADKPSIQAGIDAAAFGDTVLVAPGYYLESLHMKHGVALLGSPAAMPVIHTSDGWSVVHCLAGVLGPETRVEGFVIEGATNGPWASGFRCDDGSATIRYNVIRYCMMGVQLKESEGTAVVEHNTIVGNYDVGIIVYNGDLVLPPRTVVIRSNIIAANNNAGIYRSGEPLPAMPDVDYNDVWGNGVNYWNIIPGGHEISANPMFCAPSTDNFLLDSGSPCVGTGQMGTTMGALGVGCGATAVVPSSWGAIKALYR